MGAVKVIGGILLLLWGAFVTVIGLSVLPWMEEPHEYVDIALVVTFLGVIPALLGIWLLVSAAREPSRPQFMSEREMRLREARRRAGELPDVDEVDASTDSSLWRRVAQLSDDELQAIVDRAARVWDWPPDMTWRVREREAWQELEHRRLTTTTTTTTTADDDGLRSVAQLSDDELQAIVARATQVWSCPPNITWRVREREAWQELEHRRPTAARSE